VGIYGTFWFISCLFIAQNLFFALGGLRKHLVVLIVILLALYFLAVFLSPFKKYIPLNADVALVAVSYIFMGSFLRKYFISNRWPFRVIGLVITFAATLILIDKFITPGYFELDLKYARYSNPVFDYLIPLVFLCVVILISQFLVKMKLVKAALEYLGQHSLPIMYLHLLVIALLSLAGVTSTRIIVVAGTSLPVLVAWLFEQNPITYFLFNGVKRHVV
jgi:fucose 4-O-acetylase-like acetyltransferase